MALGNHRRPIGKFDAGFNERWKRHPDPQVNTEPTFWLKTGWRPEDLKGKRVLDAGCGIGRFAMVAAAYGAEVVAIDAAPEAVAATKRNCPTAKVHQDDLLAIRHVPPRSVDMAFAIGTLHHTGDTRKAIAEVAKTVKPGGEFSLWVYCQPVEDRLLPVLEFMHDLTRAIPPARLYEIIAKHAVKIRDLYAGAWGPLEKIVRISNSANDEECISDSADWHIPQFRHWHTIEQIEQWMREAGVEPIWRGEFPVSVRGRK